MILIPRGVAGAKLGTVITPNIKDSTTTKKRNRSFVKVNKYLVRQRAKRNKLIYGLNRRKKKFGSVVRTKSDFKKVFTESKSNKLVGIGRMFNRLETEAWAKRFGKVVKRKKPRGTGVRHNEPFLTGHAFAKAMKKTKLKDEAYKKRILR